MPNLRVVAHPAMCFCLPFSKSNTTYLRSISIRCLQPGIDNDTTVSYLVTGTMFFTYNRTEICAVFAHFYRFDTFPLQKLNE